MGFACYQLEQIPDLSLSKYQSLADTGVFVQRVELAFICSMYIYQRKRLVSG